MISGQDQKVADSLALIYQADTLKGEKKMKLLSELAFNELNDRELLLKYAEELIDLASAENNNIYLSRGYTRQGYYHMFNGDLEKALESFIKSAEVAADANYPKGEAAAFTTIADVYSTMGNVENAELYYNKSIQLSREMNDSIALASVLLNAGDFYFNNDQYDKALEYVEESGPIFKKFNHITGTAYYLGNSAMIYAKQGADSLALDRFNQAIAILEEAEDYYPVSVYLTYISDIFLRQHKSSVALDYALRSLELAEDYNLREQISGANLQLSKVYEQAGNPDKALNYYKNYVIYRDSLKNIETVQQLADLRTNYEVSQKQAEVDLLNQKRKTQRNLNIAAAAGSLLFVLLALGLYNRYNFIRRTSVKIKAQRDEIESQRDLVVTQKNEIVDSINYAQKIQSALLPSESNISRLLNEYFIFYRPRDIVSGDFYWIKQVNGQIILAAADCTGHGVPGAFMSLLGISYLNEIVQSEEITRTDQVLDHLRNKIIDSLKQRGAHEDAKDGMDLALCMLDQDRQILQFSGANNSLYLIREVDGKPGLAEYHADRMPIGYYQGEEKPFTNNNIRLKNGDTFYLFTDGFLDQKGGDNNRKYMRKGFKKLLLELSAEPMAKQKAILDKTLSGWMGDNPQT
ncbi:MAG: tetratricopeptide repeat protein, partial [Bacteroidales bacterium]